MVEARKQESALKNPWVWLLIGIMGTALIVNGVLITLAFLYPPGLVVDDYYDRGKNYLYHQAKVKDDIARLGWELQLDAPKSPKVDGSDSYIVRAVDRDGKGIEGAAVEFAAFRPVENGQDFVLPMRDIGAGFYSVSTGFSRPGNWDLIVTVQQGEDKLDVAQRVFVKD
ncbi:FixH family protein [Pseudomonadota bacterium]